MSFLWLFVLLTLTTGIITQVKSLNFSFPGFDNESTSSLLFSKNASVAFNAIYFAPHEYDRQLSYQNYSGRAFFNQPFNLWDQNRGMKASFHSSFEINIVNLSSVRGDGLAFILSRNTTLPNNSEGQWLGIMSSSTVDQPNNIVAVEFDTRKSYKEDIDDNHVGIDINSIFSITQEPLGPGINLSNGVSVLASVEYDASGRLSISVEQEGHKNTLFYDVDLSEHLPEYVFVGFSAATQPVHQVNSVRSWNFNSFEVISAKKNSNLIWVGITVPVITIILLIGIAYKVYVKKKLKRKEMLDDPEMEQEIQRSSTAPQKFKLKELISATGNFNPIYKLGEGGFGTVYKGIIDNKQEVAVKRILKNSRHGKQDFLAEITTIGNLHHKNLVKLIGWCYGSDELLLVYDFMPNGSLDKLLFRKTMSRTEESILSWDRRHGIICGVAQALDYLHYGCEKRVLHRDIKASNIMLDSDFNARIGDFGLARTIQLGEKSHYSTKEIAGTPGYMAPESFHTRRATVETDVYAFGVLVLEIVCGRKPGYQGNIIDWVWDNYRKEMVIDVVDTRLNGNFDREQTECLLMLGLACCHPNPYERPSMRRVLKVLTGEAPPPIIPVEKPAFMWPAMAALMREESVQILSGGQLTLTMEYNGR